MFGKRLPLLSAFAGGCLCTAALVGFWQTSAAKPSARATQSVPAEVAHALTESIAAASLAPEAPLAEARQPERGAAQVEASVIARKPESGEPVPEAGTSVADTLSRLEASYREALAVAAQAKAPPNPSPVVAPAASSLAVAQVAVAPTPSRAVMELAVAAPPAVALAAAAPSLGAASQPALRTAEVNEAQAPIAAAALPAPAAEARPSAADVGAAQTSVYIGSTLYQGDAFVLEQQLAVLQYLQLIAPLGYAGVTAPAQGRSSRRETARAAAVRSSAFPSTSTNPGNPWGFSWLPTIPVK